MSEDKLFDDIERKELAPGFRWREFQFLNGSSGSEATTCRTMLEDWFHNYPVEGRSDIRGRIRSYNDRHFQSAFFELFLYQLLTRLGCNIEVHPPMEATSKKPDFLVTSSNGEKFYLEATVVTDLTDEEEKREARKDTVYDTINKINSPNFWIDIFSVDGPSTSPPGKKIAKFLEEKLKKLNPTNSDENLPKWKFEFEGWEIIFTPRLKVPEIRGKSDIRPIGFMSGPAEWATTSESIRKSLDDKAKKYGELDYPYIIAINVLGVVDLHETVMCTLFGNQCVNIKTFERKRTGDGFWIKNGKAINKKVSGILAFGRLSHWGVLEGNHCLFFNPYIESDLLNFPRYTKAGEEYTFLKGLNIGDIFRELPVS